MRIITDIPTVQLSAHFYIITVPLACGRNGAVKYIAKRALTYCYSTISIVSLDVLQPNIPGK